MKFDDASWYLESVTVKTDNPYSIASGHIVAYLQWCLKRGWAGILHIQENSNQGGRVLDSGSILFCLNF